MGTAVYVGSVCRVCGNPPIKSDEEYLFFPVVKSSQSNDTAFYYKVPYNFTRYRYQIFSAHTKTHLRPLSSNRARTESSSSESSPLTPPRPLHPPSAFSDSRELSEAECDREIFQSEGGSGGGSRPRRQSEGEDIKAELTVLLQRYKQQQEVQQQQLQQAKTSRGADKNPYTINV